MTGNRDWEFSYICKFIVKEWGILFLTPSQGESKNLWPGCHLKEEVFRSVSSQSNSWIVQEEKSSEVSRRQDSIPVDLDAPPPSPHPWGQYGTANEVIRSLGLNPGPCGPERIKCHLATRDTRLKHQVHVLLKEALQLQDQRAFLWFSGRYKTLILLKRPKETAGKQWMRLNS